MSLSTKKVLQLLKQEGILRMEDISSSLPNYTCRTLRNAIKQLKQMELIDSQPDLNDMRRRFYIYKKTAKREGEVAQNDFDFWVGGPGQSSYVTAENPSLARYADKYPHSTRAYGAASIDFIRQSVKKDQPFCMTVFFKAPHRPVEPDPMFDGALPNKLFEYMCAGLPMICMNAPDVSQFLMATGMGVTVNDVNDIPDAMQYMRDRKFRRTVWANRWSWTQETQIPKVTWLYEKVLGRSLQQPIVPGEFKKGE